MYLNNLIVTLVYSDVQYIVLLGILLLQTDAVGWHKSIYNNILLDI